MNSSLRDAQARRVRVVARQPGAGSDFDRDDCDCRELDLLEDLSSFERDFLVAFHDVCSEFVVMVLHKIRVTDVEKALTSGTLDLAAMSIWLEHRALQIIGAYRKIFRSQGGIDLSSVGISMRYDCHIKDIVVRISFFRE